MKTILAALISITATLAHAADILNTELPYQAGRDNPVIYDVDFSVVVTPPNNAKVLKVWLPIPQTDVGQEVTNSQLSTFPTRVEPQVGIESVYGNKFAYFEFANPAGAKIIRHRFKIKVWELRWHLDADKVESPSTWPSAFDRYRTGDHQAVVVDNRFTSLVHQIVPKPGNPLRDFSAVMNWVNANFTYDHVDASLRADSVHGLEKHHGHCSDYHSFCASLGRAMGYPTRVTYGINTFPKNSPSHCKLEAFLPPYGWVSFDVSETQRMIDAIKADTKLDAKQKGKLTEAANNRLTNGFRDNTWFCQTRGTDYQLVPEAQKRVPVIRTAYIEADGVALPEPDPANSQKHEYAWMTVHEYRANRQVTYPFKDIASLKSD